MVEGCGKICESMWPERGNLDREFAWVPVKHPTPGYLSFGGFSGDVSKPRVCGDWYEDKRWWQLVCRSCLLREGLIW